MSTPGIPGVAQLAIQSGRFAAHTIRRRLAGKDDGRAFVYRDKGSLATIAKYRAVASIRATDSPVCRYGSSGSPYISGRSWASDAGCRCCSAGSSPSPPTGGRSGSSPRGNYTPRPTSLSRRSYRCRCREPEPASVDLSMRESGGPPASELGAPDCSMWPPRSRCQCAHHPPQTGPITRRAARASAALRRCRRSLGDWSAARRVRLPRP